MSSVPPDPKIPANLEAAELRGAMARACDHEQCGGGQRCLFPENTACVYCGVEMDGDVDELVWYRDGRGWRHKRCSDRSLAEALAPFIGDEDAA